MNWETEIQSISIEDFNLLKKVGKRSNTLNLIQATELYYLPYFFVKSELPELLNGGNYKAVFSVMFENKLNFNQIKTNDAFETLLWIFDSYNDILKVEKQYLSSFPDPDLMAAGINRLNEVGELNVTDSVAQRFGYKIEEVEQLKYHKVFDLQRKMKLEADIQRDLQKIRENKQNRK